MPKVKIRCPQCGARNEDIEMCRICGLSLPNAAAIRSQAGAGGPAFKESVEHERTAWRDYSEGRTLRGIRSRRPEQLPTLPPQAWDDPAAYVAAGGDIGPVRDRRKALTLVGLTLVVVAIVMAAAWYLFLRDDSASVTSPVPAESDAATKDRDALDAAMPSPTVFGAGFEVIKTEAYARNTDGLYLDPSFFAGPCGGPGEMVSATGSSNVSSIYRSTQPTAVTLVQAFSFATPEAASELYATITAPSAQGCLFDDTGDPSASGVTNLVVVDSPVRGDGTLHLQANVTADGRVGDVFVVLRGRAVLMMAGMGVPADAMDREMQALVQKLDALA